MDWTTDAGRLAAIEPSPEEVATHAGDLVGGYNEPANAALMGHTEPMSEQDVVDHYADMADEGARQFLLFVDGKLVGDADLRNPSDGAAEFAFMIAAPGTQGKGLGTKFALMIHACAFGPLALDRVYASIVPHNTASRRVFEKLGYTVDDSPAGRAFAEHPADIVMSIDRKQFEKVNARELAQIVTVTR